MLLISSQNGHVRDLMISKSACAQHHFPVILIRDPMEGFGRYLATQPNPVYTGAGGVGVSANLNQIPIHANQFFYLMVLIFLVIRKHHSVLEITA